ncbi:MAG: hypothetical protein HUU55_17385 [Myxococcales bacterium]|nr:hypothetical protein [Myxococcales bacterium]
MTTQTPPGRQQRTDGIDSRYFEERLQGYDDLLKKYMDPLDYRNLNNYLARASIRYVLGWPTVDWLDDLYWAFRCIHTRGDMHLDRVPPERFITRRMLPIELALLSGQPVLVADVADELGLSVAVLMDHGSEELDREAELLTGFFRRGSSATYQDLSGLGAIVYVASLTALARGFDDEAALALNLYGAARQALSHVHPEKNVVDRFRRYDRLCLGVACLLNQDSERLGALIGELVEHYDLELRGKLGDCFARPPEIQRYFDSGSLALCALSVLREMPIMLPNKNVDAPYQEALAYFRTAPPREAAPQSALDQESKDLLTAMGVDPHRFAGTPQAPANLASPPDDHET